MAVVYTKQKGGYRIATLQILNGQVNSDSLEMQGGTLVGLQIPVALTGTSLKVQGSTDNSNWFDMKKSDNTAIAITTPTTAGLFKFAPADTDAVPYIRFVSQAAEAADRNLTAFLADYKV